MHTPTIFNQTDRSETFTCYNSTGPVAGVSSCNDIVAEFDNRIITILWQRLSTKQPIYFMPTDVSDEAENINEMSTYILCITGTLINGQKVIMNIANIKLFFDAEVPDNYSSSSFKTILARILSTTLKNTSKFGFEDIRAFSLQGYHTKKKAYIRVNTWDYFNSYNALKTVCKVGIYTTSDDLTLKYYYRKVVCKERLPLSSWATLSNYLYVLLENIYLFQVSVNNYNPISEVNYNNPLFFSALSWDCTPYSYVGYRNI
ncbi:hypothetical protein RclHR1_01960017 [Rhizophagus clarus]|uniref:Ribonuclease H-like domain-containing protein n=1 Tax=Rhizophagus clarus TaxID=94130 RepID=A0A2Z6QPV3_9GLOM|nr:hypothetical protein RclHR1_01960017 [Rhizophagus clarus]GES78533.1 ribonuclease H-like domain-containing protein [Rhizophagus clarus]